ncbi:MAG: DNA-binding protein [Candidatus Aenigmatarchaeota archaeon]
MNQNQFDANKLAQIQQIEALKKQMLNKILTPEANERLSRVRLVNPALANQAELYLINIYETHNVKERVTDINMKEVLKTLSAKKSINIKRR